jgi:hypothetical protein
LLAACTDEVITRVVADGASDTDPREAIRAIASGMFDAIDAHPWVGAQLARAPWQQAMLHIFDGIGRHLQALGVPEQAQFDCGSALVNYILGVAGQNAANARLLPRDTDRRAFLTALADEWSQLDPASHPFIHRVAARLADHDDREQFLAGVDLILAGIGTLR